MIYRTHNEQTIFDLIINTTNDLDSLYGVILDNPEIKNIDNIPVSININYSAPSFVPLSISSSKNQIISTKQNFYSKNNQTIFDIAIQTYVDLNQTYKLISESNFTNIQTYPVSNTLFTFNPQFVIDNLFKKYLSSKGLIINTGNHSNYNYLQTDDGIDITTDDGIQITID